MLKKISKKLFEIAQEFANEIGTEIKMPRVVGVQRHRPNYECKEPEDYHRLSVFIPFVDHYISQLGHRFLNHKNFLSHILNLLPNTIVSVSDDEIEDTIDTITSQWPNVTDVSENIVKKEALLWK